MIAIDYGPRAMAHSRSACASTRTTVARRLRVAAIMACAGGCFASLASHAATSTMAEPIPLPAFKVVEARFEDFGFRVSHDFDLKRSTTSRKIYTPVVDVVLPNTAASKAGVRPGDRILLADGRTTASRTSALRGWRAIQEAKWNEVAAGKSGVTWTLQVETAGTEEIRTLKLQLPTPAPHWGSTVWRLPDDRSPAAVPESGPLAALAEQMLNNGIWMLLRNSYVRGFNLPTNAAEPYFLCYSWTLWSGTSGHRIYVSRQRGRTDIILEAISKEGMAFFSRAAPAIAPERNLASATTVFAIDAHAYLTSPSGALERAWRLPRSNRQQEIPLPAARAGFQAEVDFWLTKVGRDSPLWPFSVLESPRRFPLANERG